MSLILTSLFCVCFLSSSSNSFHLMTTFQIIFRSLISLNAFLYLHLLTCFIHIFLSFLFFLLILLSPELSFTVFRFFLFIHCLFLSLLALNTLTWKHGKPALCSTYMASLCSFTIFLFHPASIVKYLSNMAHIVQLIKVGALFCVCLTCPNSK